MSPDKLSIVVFSGHFDRVHYALIMAAAAAAIDKPVTLFFTMGACRALEKAREGGDPPWRAMPLCEGGGTGGELDDSFRAKGIAGFEELLGSCVELGVRFMVCETGLKALDLTAAELRADIPVKPGGVVSLLAAAGPDGAMRCI
ncbi:MAG: DsrE/DsrF/DrsH-like family protein [Proteobacteria bacterium]|nr:DsrE/DsrF/DrsH-like family protein [Pseudomonadota bacterium]